MSRVQPLSASASGTIDDAGSPTPGARWRQIQAAAVATPEGLRAYEAGYQQAASYRQLMRVLNQLRRALGISQTELAARLDRSQPTIARLLAQTENPTLGSVAEVLRGLGLRGRLIVEPSLPEHDAFVIEVKVDKIPAAETTPVAASKRGRAAAPIKGSP